MISRRPRTCAPSRQTCPWGSLYRRELRPEWGITWLTTAEQRSTRSAAAQHGLLVDAAVWAEVTIAASAYLVPEAVEPVSHGIARRRWDRTGAGDLGHGGFAAHPAWALNTGVLTRMRTDAATRDYVARRTAEGETGREIRRCLKRYTTRQIYRASTPQPQPARPTRFSGLTAHRSLLGWLEPLACPGFPVGGAGGQDSDRRTRYESRSPLDTCLDT